MKPHAVFAPLIRAAFIVVFGASAIGQPGPDVPYVPTPEDVVDTMLEMAEVTEDDIVYDLGCGDGRIVITAASRYGAHGVGVDLDPQRIEESIKNAVAAGVTDKVEFRQMDLFQTDIGSATVLTLYLLTYVNMKLRPKIFDELKPGTRVVSHNYGMDDWKPDGYREIPGRWSEHKVFYWVVPANVSGEWTWDADTGGGSVRNVLTVMQTFQEVGGMLITGDSSKPLCDISVDGGVFRLAAGEGSGFLQYEGIADGDMIEGTVRVGVNGDRSIPWRAVRTPGSKTDIDK